MSTVFSSCVPCDMLSRTPFAPAAISCSTISGSREAGPRVIRIFARLISGSRSLKSSFDRFVDVLTCLWSKADEMFHELALTIKNKRLRNRVRVGKQKGYEIFVRLGERVLNAE